MRLRCGIRFGRVCVALVCLFFTSVPAQSQPDCRDAAVRPGRALPAPYRPTDSKDIVYLRVAGTRYAIPRNYFRYPPIGCDTEESGFLLRVLLPTFEGWLKEKDRQFRGSPGEPREWMNILLQVIPDAAMQRAFAAYARGVDPDGDYPLWDGLLATTNQYGEDVYFSRDSKDVDFLMVCKTGGQVRFPFCQEHFRYRGAMLKLSFARQLISSWHSIRAGTVTLLDAFAYKTEQ
jgi:hypothetical protein